MELTVCKIDPRAPFHLGTKENILEDTSEFIHSDTLFSAICNVYRLLYGKDELEELLNSYTNNTPPFLISSAFPYVNCEKDVLLFPLPKSVDLGRYVKDYKKYKKIELVSKDLFVKMIAGKANFENSFLIQSNKVLITSNEIKNTKEIKIWSTREVPRVAIDSKTSASSIYHFGEVVYLNGGLYFLIDFKNSYYTKKVKAAIRVLGDEGIGGDRTYGKGIFKIKGFEPIKFDITSNRSFVTLSLYYPKPDELHGLKGDYDIIKTGGWIYSIEGTTHRRKVVRMFTEGSVFEKPIKMYGKLVPVAPSGFSHDVYRYGYAFPIPCR